jgi:hypothetical protein
MLFYYYYYFFLRFSARKLVRIHIGTKSYKIVPLTNLLELYLAGRVWKYPPRQGTSNAIDISVIRISKTKKKFLGKKKLYKAEHVRSSGNTSNLYSRVALFDSLTAHRRSKQKLFALLASPSSLMLKRYLHVRYDCSFPHPSQFIIN